MEVASLPTDESRDPGHVTKRLLQGRPLPAILVDNHPGPRYPTFRPHQRRLSQQKGGSSQGREGASTPCDSGVSFSSPEGDSFHQVLPAPTATKSPLRTSVPKMAKGKKKKRTTVGPSSTAAGATSGAGASGTTSGATGTTSGVTGTTSGVTGTGVAASTNTGPSGGVGGGGAGLMSSNSSGVSSGRGSEQLHRKGAQKGIRLAQYGRASTMEMIDYSVNPEPVPFMPSNFIRHHTVLPFGFTRSSTMLKKIPIPKRHQDTFGGYEYNFTGQRGVMMHTDRYQVRTHYEALKNLEGLSQRDRLLAEMAYLEDLRSIRRKREMVPHRVQLDLYLGGKKLDFEERFDIKREIQRLKAMAMPDRARDLFHGKGIHLPPDHMSLMPRPSRGPEEDSDSEDEVRISAPTSIQRTMEHAYNLDLQSPSFERQISLTLGDVPHTRAVVRGKRHQQLPGIGKTHPSGADTGQGAGYLAVRFRLPSRGVPDLHSRFLLRRPPRDDTNTSTSQPSVPLTSRSAAWVEEQNQLLPRQPRTTPADKLARVPPTGPQPSPRTGHVQKSARAPTPEVAPSPTSATSPAAGLTTDQSRVESALARAVESGSSQGRVQQHVLIKEDETHQGSLEGRQPSPPVSHTPNPLKAGMDLDVTEEQECNLRQTFQRLDTDMDGDLKYHQLKSQLPKEFSRQQEWFVKQVYEITRSSTAFFGVDEFLMMTQLTNRVATLTGQAQEAYGKIDFETLEGCIINYVELFQEADSSQRGRISAEALKQLLGKSQNKAPPDENSHVWNTILDFVSLDYASHVSRIEYLAHIPLFMALVPPNTLLHDQ